VHSLELVTSGWWIVLDSIQRPSCGSMKIFEHIVSSIQSIVTSSQSVALSVFQLRSSWVRAVLVPIKRVGAAGGAGGGEGGGMDGGGTGGTGGDTGGIHRGR